MKEPQNIADAENQLAEAFQIVTGPGPRPKVTVVARDEKQRVVIAVCYRGNELVRAMQVESFIVEQGDSVRHRSQLKDGNTILVYQQETKKRK
jgi:hypothetical protein